MNSTAIEGAGAGPPGLGVPHLGDTERCNGGQLMTRGNAEKGCLGLGLVLWPFGPGLGYVLAMATWRLGRFLWTTGGPRLVDGAPKSWTALGLVLFFVAVVAFIHWDAGRTGPNPLAWPGGLPGRRLVLAARSDRVPAEAEG